MLCDAIYSQIICGRSEARAFNQGERRSFVETGFARHRGRETVIDKPLEILAAMGWFDRQPQFSMFNALCHDIHKHSPCQNGSEAYLTFYLRQMFKDAETLDKVYTLRGPVAWQSDEFELVTVNASRGQPQREISVVTPTPGPSSNIGIVATSGEVVEWLTTHRFTFCFPRESFGPDVLFFLRHKTSKKLLLVTIQAKNYESVDRQTLMKGIRTVTPSWFWKSKDMKVCRFLLLVCICFD